MSIDALALADELKLTFDTVFCVPIWKLFRCSIAHPLNKVDKKWQKNDARTSIQPKHEPSCKFCSFSIMFSNQLERGNPINYKFYYYYYCVCQLSRSTNYRFLKNTWARFRSEYLPTLSIYIPVCIISIEGSVM